MAHFYLDEALENAEPGEVLTVTGAEARHAVTVSRVSVGEAILLGNGRGLVVRGEVVGASAGELSVRVTGAQRHPPAAPAVWLAQALAKGDRDENAVQQATELGVDGVIPWAAQRSIVRWEGQKAAKGAERWRAIVREATKQSVRPWLPEVAGLATTAQLATRGGRMLVLEPTAATPLSALELDGRDLLLVVGPEGGVSPQELERLAAAGGEAVRLGDTVLRTSTAGPAALAVLGVMLGRW